jgi:hypothetical protein
MKQLAFKMLAPALTAQVNRALPHKEASHADTWLAEHFQKLNALASLLG